MKTVHIIGGGTTFPVRTHFSLAAEAYGTAARQLAEQFSNFSDKVKVQLHLTKMAESSSQLRTNNDIANLIDQIKSNPEPSIIILSAALCDFEGFILSDGERTESGPKEPRLQSNQAPFVMELITADKVLSRVRSKNSPNPRKDIFLVGFKTTDGIPESEMFLAGLKLLKNSSCNLVLVNDVKTKTNIIVTPEQAKYAVPDFDRLETFKLLTEMTLSRSEGSFSRTEVSSGELIPLISAQVPVGFANIVNNCIQSGAYKPVVNNKTVGHFAFKIDSNTLVSSRRHQNFNEFNGSDLVLVKFPEASAFPAQALGAKPSAGAWSQIQLFRDFPQFDCVVHFHCPLKSNKNISTKPQKYFECGSHQCGQNTSSGIQLIKLSDQTQIGVVMLEQHGPNILFSSSSDWLEIWNFIRDTFDFNFHTGML